MEGSVLGEWCRSAWGVCIKLKCVVSYTSIEAYVARKLKLGCGAARGCADRGGRRQIQASTKFRFYLTSLRRRPR